MPTVNTLCDVGKCPTCGKQYAVLRESGMIVAANCDHAWKLGPRAETKTMICEICDRPNICDPSGKLVYLSLCTCWRDSTGFFSNRNDGLYRLGLEPIGAETIYIESQLKKVLENQKLILASLGYLLMGKKLPIEFLNMPGSDIPPPLTDTPPLPKEQNKPVSPTIPPVVMPVVTPPAAPPPVQTAPPPPVPAAPPPPVPESAPAPEPDGKDTPKVMREKMEAALRAGNEPKSFRCPAFLNCDKASGSKKSCRDVALSMECAHFPTELKPEEPPAVHEDPKPQNTEEKKDGDFDVKIKD